MRALSLGLILGCLPALAIAQESPVPPQFTEVIAKIQELRAADTLLTLSVAAVHDGSILWEAGFGAAPSTVYRLASVSKSLTAIGVMTLVQQHRLELDAPVSRYLGTKAVRVLRGREQDLTVRRLLNMTGGIPHVVNFYWSDGPPPLEEKAMLQRFGFSAFAPGETFHYSNMSFGVAQSVVSAVAGMPFDVWMRQEVFAPLGMTRTRLRPDADTSAEAAAYQGTRNPVRLPVGGLEPDGGAGFRSSAHDLALLAAALTDPKHDRLLSRQSVDTMWDFRRLGFYALGWWRGLGQSSETVAIADGAAAGSSATIEVHPSRGIAVIALANRGSGVTNSLTGMLARAAELMAGQEPTPPGVRPELPDALRDEDFALDAPWRGEWCGAITQDERKTPVALRIGQDSVISFSIGQSTGLAQPGSQITAGTLRISFAPFDAPAPVLPGAYQLALFLRTDGATLYGYASASSTDARPHFVHTFPVSFTRARPGLTCPLH
ncbi:MAG TPA: serine hydrolase domain-containing protein [Gemmatimonadales bacterium]|nr:serine hydrolase domain-containing protein [Gemmatimonadales bacterium]